MEIMSEMLTVMIKMQMTMTTTTIVKVMTKRMASFATMTMCDDVNDVFIPFGTRL